MKTWTTAAQRALDHELEKMRLAAAESGADPDEVLEDLRRHVTEEANASGVSVVTEDDVRRWLARVAPPWAARVESTATAPLKPVGSGGAKGTGGEVGARLLDFVLLLFGVALPLITLGIEARSHLCAREILDPLPSGWHGLLVGMVPVVHFLTWWRVGRRRTAEAGGRVSEGELRRWWVLNGWVTGVAAVYAALFLPLTPFAVVGVIFGLGLLALAPLGALVSGLVLRSRVAGACLDRRPLPRLGWWSGCVGAWVVLLLLAVPGVITQHWMQRAELALDPEAEVTDVSRRSAEVHEWVEKLRDWGDGETLLRACYGRRKGLWSVVLPEPVRIETARELHYRVTGRAFNAVPPPSGALGRVNRGWMEEFAEGGDEWDSALGGEAVAGRVRGLSMQDSRLDALANAEEGWAYVEWTMEFHNSHERLQREARAQIQLPPGAVVSRLTLWVNGEEREAAFAGRAEVRAAYQKVAVVQRRDPVLVTTCGPDRVLMQCFPIPSGGGRMRVRLGITAPMAPRGLEEGVLIWPCFLERNFALARGLEHSVWVESKQTLKAPEGLQSTADERGRSGWRGSWPDVGLGETRRNLVFLRDRTVTELWAPGPNGSEGRRVRQRWAQVMGNKPRRLALVLDGSVGMAPFYRDVASALEGMPADMELAVFLAQDGVRRVFTDLNGARAAEAVRRMEGRGGQDNVGALVQAWEWAAVEASGVVLWVHGPQAVALQPTGPLRQRLEWRGDGRGPALHEIQVRLGPDRVVEALDGLEAVQRVPRLGTVGEDLESLVAWWAGRGARWEYVREVQEGMAPGTTESGVGVSRHVTRLWAADEIRRLVRARRVSEASKLGAAHQLVTRVTGAVVLETQQQYADAGLHPVDPLTVPVVPEPRIPGLLVLGMVVLLARAKRAGVRPGARGGARRG
ncbi:MAG: hypothetical protein IT580_08055 [Verrucomicrobiales bacterium]|nr:hypothetical protein [Verrucomicrobiales bacterium]